MALNPLTAAEKRAIDYLAQGVFAGSLSKNIEGMEGYHAFFIKKYPQVAQVERRFKKALHDIHKAGAEQLKPD